MQVSKVPPADVATVRTATAIAATSAEQGSSPTVNTAPPADRADIRPLDVLGALQILLAEVRASLDAILLKALPAAANTPSAAPAQSPQQASRELVEMFLRAVPEDDSDPAAWTAAVARAETALQTSVEAALATISAWRDVPPAVVDAAKEARTLVFSALADEPQNPLWLRPEWLGLAPRIQRFWRRRRHLRRRLSDPDYRSGTLQDEESFR
jgi:hypothetical protein